MTGNTSHDKDRLNTDENGPGNQQDLRPLFGPSPEADEQTGENGAGKPAVATCGFFRRLFAFLIDGGILGGVGLLIGGLLFSMLARSNMVVGRALGFLIAGVYFGIGNSALTGGQTPGKKLLGIVVQHTSGQCLSLSVSVGRYVILASPYFLNRLQFPPFLVRRTAFKGATTLVLPAIVFGASGAIIYLFLFNRRTRQSLHDLVARTAVVMESAAGGRVAERTWWVHKLVGYGWIAIVALTSVFFAGYRFNTDISADMETITDEIRASYANLGDHPEVLEGSIKRRVREGSTPGPRLGSYVVLAIRLNRWHNHNEPDAFHRKLARTVLTEKLRNETDQVIIETRYGYDLGIASLSWSFANRVNLNSPR